MFATLRARILWIFPGIVLLSLMTIVFIVQQETVQSISAEMDESSRNLVHTISLNVGNQYQSIQFHRAASLDKRKRELKNVLSLAVSYLEFFKDQADIGLISEAEAQRKAIAEIRNLRYDNNVGYFWINDTGRPIPRMITHATIPELDGTILDAPRFNCALGRQENLFKAFVDVCLDQGEGFVDYMWPKPTASGLTTEKPKLSFVKLYEPWNWIIGTGIYTDDIEADAQERLDAVLEELEYQFDNITIANTGYMFLFDGNREMLIHRYLKGEDFSKLINPSTDRPLLDDLIAAASTSKNGIEYLWEKPPNHSGEFRFLKKSYVKYFEPLDWYIASSVYYDDITDHANIVRNKIILIAVLFLVLVLGSSILLSRNLAKPLSKLTKAANGINEHGLTTASIPVSGTLETQELGTILNSMLVSVRKGVQEKERLLQALAGSNKDLHEINDRLELEITERLRVESVIKAALKEKEVLLKEVHHRVKNNMAVILSMLRLQASDIEDQGVKIALNECRSRIKSMSLIHESLYRSDDLAKISLQKYIQNLGQSLLYAVEGNSGRVQLNIQAKDVVLSLEQAVPCGLIINEILTNSLKYAFPANNTGEIQVLVVEEGGFIQLVVHDNGIGLEEGFDTRKPDTLGMRIVSILVEDQLEGTWTATNENGAKFVVRWQSLNVPEIQGGIHG